MSVRRTRMSRRIGVFGGTFDPPHIGHLVAAVDVREHLRLDVVLLVVANEPWQKVGERALAPAADRLAMVAAAVDGLDGIEASDLEIRRGGLTYTADTLAQLRSCEPDAELFLILGADAAAGLASWERLTEVTAAAALVVVTRPGTDPAALLGLDISATVEIPRLDIASSEIRARIGAGRPVDFLVPEAVASFIGEHGLYGGMRV